MAGKPVLCDSRYCGEKRMVTVSVKGKYRRYCCPHAWYQLVYGRGEVKLIYRGTGWKLRHW